MMTSSLSRPLALALSCLLLSGCGDLEQGKVNLDGWAVTLQVDPPRVTYLPGELVTVTAEVRTDSGAVITAPVLEWTSSGATLEGEEQYRLAPFEALARITACLRIEESSVCGDEELPIDIHPPTVTIATPSPGDQLLAGDSGGAVLVTGTIVDTNPDARLALFVNGNRADIAPDGAFEYALPVEFGITHLVIEGSDGFHPPTQAQMDVLMADGYLPPEDGTTRFELPGAVSIRLTQKFFDPVLGSSDLDTSTAPILASNVASIVELVLTHIDLTSLFGDGPIFDDAGLVLGVEEIEVGHAVVDVEILDGDGLKLTLDVSNVRVHLDGSIDLGIVGDGSGSCGGSGVFELEGPIETDIGGTLVLTLTTDAEGLLVGQVEDVELAVGSIMPMFTGPCGGFWSALINLGSAQVFFHDLLRDQLEGELIAEFVDVVPGILTDLLNSVGGIFADTEIVLPLPPEFGEPLTIQLDSRMGDLTLVGGAETGHLDVALDLSVETVAPPIHTADSRGLPQAAMDPAPPFNHALGVQLAIRQDLINGLLHSLWNAGLLDVEVDAAGQAAVITPRLPPVLKMAPLNSTCVIDGVRCDAIIQIGQLEISALGAVSAVSLEVGAIVSFVDGAISLKVDQNPDFTLWTVVQTPLTALINTMVLQYLEEDILPALTDLVGEELLIELPLPTPETLGLASIAPGLAEAALDIQTFGRIESATGYLGLGADLALIVP